MFSLQAAPLGVAEPLLGNVERSQVREGLTNGLQVFVQTCAGRAEARTSLWRRPDDRDWVGKQCRAFPLAGRDTPGGDKSHRFPLMQGMTLARTQDCFLGCLGQSAKCVGHCGTDRALLDFPRHCRRQARRQGEPARNPRFALPQKLSHGGEAEAVVFDQGPDDARLIHGRRGARGRIRAQQQELQFRRSARAFDDRRDQGLSRFLPARQTLEAVDNLE